MVSPIPLVEGLAVSPQIQPEDFTALAAAGYRTVINNRPDGEEMAQLSAAEGAALAARAGLTYVYLPVTMANLSPETIATFKAALESQPGPILAHCKSGTRSTILWALSQVGEQSVESILAIAAQAGYDLSQVRPLLEHFASTAS